MKKANDSTEERTNKKEKRYPNESIVRQELNISLECGEKFECLNYQQQERSSPDINTLIKIINNNVEMSNSSTFLDNNYPQLLIDNSSISKNLMNSFERTQREIDFDLLYDLNMSMVSLEDYYFNIRIANKPLSKQKAINAHMRMILLNWILEICAQLGFKRETYHLSVFLIDSFLQSYEDLQTGDFQLLGVTCLMISSKIEVRIKLKFYIFIISGYLKLNFKGNLHSKN